MLIRDIPKSTSEGNTEGNENARRYASIDRDIVGDDGDDEDRIATLRAQSTVCDASAQCACIGEAQTQAENLKSGFEIRKR